MVSIFINFIGFHFAQHLTEVGQKWTENEGNSKISILSFIHHIGTLVMARSIRTTEVWQDKKSTFYCVEWKYFLSSIKKLWFFKSIIKEWQSHSDYSAKNSKNTWSPSPYIRKINSFSEKKFNIFQENKYLIASGRIWTDISNIYQYWHKEINQLTVLSIWTIQRFGKMKKVLFIALNDFFIKKSWVFKIHQEVSAILKKIQRIADPPAPLYIRKECTKW